MGGMGLFSLVFPLFPQPPAGLPSCMHGNVWQWCQESAWGYVPGAGGRPAEDKEDIRYITDKLSRVLRGGSFDGLPRDVRSAYRGNYRPANRDFSIGLRVARTRP